MMMNLTHSQKTAEAKASGARAWILVDAAGIPLGRLATTIANRLRGKHKPTYTPTLMVATMWL
jgi:large subunit ribosomal protein L13